MGVGPIKSRQWAAEPNPCLWSVVCCCYHFRMVVTLLMASMQKTYLLFCCFWVTIVFTAWKIPETTLTIWHINCGKNVCNIVTLHRFIHNQSKLKTDNSEMLQLKQQNVLIVQSSLLVNIWRKKVSLIWGCRCSVSHCNLLTLLAIDLK